jgi:endonuclease-3 related protein
LKKALQTIYRKLFSAFGPQGWWPAQGAFEVIVGAILTQNTNWKNVERAIKNLRKEGVLNYRSLRGMPKKRLARIIKPAGYFNIKADRLKAFLNFLFHDYNGSLKKMCLGPTDLLRRQLLDVKGVGYETADSILLYAAGKPVFVVDAYTKRILYRHGLIRQNSAYQQIQDLFMQNLSRNVKLFNEYHALLVKLGKEFCLKNKPRCGICPLRRK